MINEGYFFQSLDSIIDDSSLWILSWEYDILLRVRKSTFTVENYYCIPCSKIEPFQHLMISSSDNEVYVLPYNGQELYMIDKNDNSLSRISIPYSDTESKMGAKFAFSVYWKGIIALFSGAFNKVYYYDDKMNLLLIDDLSPLFTGSERKTSLITEFYAQIDNIVYIPVYQTNVFLRINIETKEKDFIELDKHYRLHTIMSYKEENDNKLMLVTLDDETIIWSSLKGIERSKKNKIKEETDKYKYACCINNKYYYIPERQDVIYVEKNGVIIPVKYKDNSNRRTNQVVQYGFVNVIDNNILFQERESGRLFILNTESDEVNAIAGGIGETDGRKIMMERYQGYINFSLIEENKYMGLKEFLNFF